MLRHHLNTLRLHLSLAPAGPLLVKAGDEGLSALARAAPYTDFASAFDDLFDIVAQREKLKREKGDDERDMEFIRTRHNGESIPYLPGSSLKGVLRARAEQIAREAHMDVAGACDPFTAVDDDLSQSGELACSAWLTEHEIVEGPAVYWRACPVCRLFGHAHLGSRLSISDAYPAPDLDVPPQLPYRDAVGIDRQRGAARGGAKFDYETWEQGAFIATLQLTNFELWHLGLLAYLLHDLLSGDLTLGYGAARGLGRLHGQIDQCELDYIGRPPAQATADQMPLLGVAKLSGRLDATFSNQYSFAAEPDPTPNITGVSGTREGIRYRYTLPPAAQDQIWEHGVAAWQSVIADYDPHDCRQVETEDPHA